MHIDKTVLQRLIRCEFCTELFTYGQVVPGLFKHRVHASQCLGTARRSPQIPQIANTGSAVDITQTFRVCTVKRDICRQRPVVCTVRATHYAFLFTLNQEK
eukprot:UN06660